MTQEDRRRQPVRISDPIDLGGDYVGWEVRFQLNTPMGVLEDLDSKDTATVYGALAKICVSSNYVDHAGEPIDVSRPEEWRKVGRDLLEQTMRAFKAGIGRPLATTTATSSKPSSPDTGPESPLVTA